MNIVQAIKCRMGSHLWTEWKYATQQGDANSTSCEIERVCTSCQAHETQQQQPHAWQPWIYLGATCDQVRLCGQCQAKESRPAMHYWSDWAYKPNSCEKVRECRRCHQHDTQAATHTWGAWTDQAPDSCQQIRVCGRCGAKETSEPSHTWGDWLDTDTPSRLQRTCSRCSARELKDTHTVSFARYYGSGVCDVCATSITSGEAYMVPVSVFYASSKYRQWLAHGPMSFMISMAGGTVDQFIARAKAMDPTSHSAVCPSCIHMFE